MWVYFAGPLFCQSEKEFNLNLAEKIENAGFSVFLPQRDGIEPEQGEFQSLDEVERPKRIFAVDRDQVIRSDIFLQILDGRIPDEGACVELGIAYENKQAENRDKLLIGLYTDFRRFCDYFPLNPMILAPLDVLCENEEDLLVNLTAYKKKMEE